MIICSNCKYPEYALEKRNRCKVSLISSGVCNVVTILLYFLGIIPTAASEAVDQKPGGGTFETQDLVSLLDEIGVGTKCELSPFCG